MSTCHDNNQAEDSNDSPARSEESTMTKDEETYYTTQEVAESLGIPVTALYALCTSYEIQPSLRRGTGKQPHLYSKKQLSLFMRLLKSEAHLQYLNKKAVHHNKTDSSTFALVSVHYLKETELRAEKWASIQGPYLDRVLLEKTKGATILRLYFGVGGIGFVTTRSIAAIYDQHEEQISAEIEKMLRNIKFRNQFTTEQKFVYSHAVDEPLTKQMLKRLAEFDMIQGPAFRELMFEETPRDLFFNLTPEEMLEIRDFFLDYFSHHFGRPYMTMEEIADKRKITREYVRQCKEKYIIRIARENQLTKYHSQEALRPHLTVAKGVKLPRKEKRGTLIRRFVDRVVREHANGYVTRVELKERFLDAIADGTIVVRDKNHETSFASALSSLIRSKQIARKGYGKTARFYPLEEGERK